MDIEGWRVRIDELDRNIVSLLSQRAHAAQEIGKLKRTTAMPIYEPNRERTIFENVRAANPGPLPDIELVHIYERIIDVMRSIQKEEVISGTDRADRDTADAVEAESGQTGETGKKS
jgi:chorismate mutase